jgi:hypothetical protein
MPVVPSRGQWLPRRSRGIVLGGVWLRVATRRRARQLDAELAVGVDPLTTDAHSLRSGQLRSQKTRRRLARSLLGAIEVSDLPPVPGALPSLVCRKEVRRCRALMVELAQRLEADAPLGVRGIAMTAVLVANGGSPLYDACARQPLDATLRATIAGLEEAGARA